MTLLQLANAVVNNPAFESKDITGDGVKETFCNWGLRLIAEGWFGVKAFNGLNANSIHAFLKANGQKVDAKTAHAEAFKRFVIAAQTNEKGSGHVAVVVPDKLHFSGKWNKDAPSVANVGVKNGIMGANFAFATEPDYFIFESK
jgi:hypothetical protein